MRIPFHNGTARRGDQFRLPRKRPLELFLHLIYGIPHAFFPRDDALFDACDADFGLSQIRRHQKTLGVDPTRTSDADHVDPREYNQFLADRIGLYVLQMQLLLPPRAFRRTTRRRDDGARISALCDIAGVILFAGIYKKQKSE